MSSHRILPALLALALPLTMVFGTLLAAGLLKIPSLWGAAILGVLLSPTDASLGVAVVTHPKVPVRIRQALNIESGLNDGIALPILAITLALAESETGPESGWYPSATDPEAWSRSTRRRCV